MGKLFFLSNVHDNVATALDEIDGGECQIIGAKVKRLIVKEHIMRGHKVAICMIVKDQPIVKYGVTIGKATRLIHMGEWVHLHNMTSLYDMRSSKAIDPRTGKVLDTQYE